LNHRYQFEKSGSLLPLYKPHEEEYHNPHQVQQSHIPVQHLLNPPSVTGQTVDCPLNFPETVQQFLPAFQGPYQKGRSPQSHHLHQV
jgi:hypothetical protein